MDVVGWFAAWDRGGGVGGFTLTAFLSAFLTVAVSMDQ